MAAAATLSAPLGLAVPGVPVAHRSSVEHQTPPRANWQRSIALAAGLSQLSGIRARHERRLQSRHVRLARESVSTLVPEPTLAEASDRAVVWFRAGDLRSQDHPGLRAASAAPQGLLCCYIFEANELARLSQRRLALLRTAVEDLQRQLRKLGMPLHILVAEDAAQEVMRLSKEVGASDVYVHEDPADVRMDGLARLQELCKEGPAIRTWRSPLRVEAGSLGQTRAHDVYAAAIQAVEPTAPLAPVDPPASWDFDYNEKIPSFEDLRSKLLASSSGGQLLLRESLNYAPGLGSDVAGEEEALRILELYVQEGAEAVAKDLWGPEGAGKDEVPRSKEEWAFRRIANGPDGYRGLRPAEVFSRTLSEKLLWLGCISMRTAAQRLQQGSEDCQAALEALEANEWHRLLALADLREAESTGTRPLDVRFFRWRGYLCRYIAPTNPTAEMPPLLAIHGFAASCTQFAPLAQALEEREHPMDVYALDLIGFGHAEKPPLSITQYVWEQCVKDFLLAVVGRPAVLMGNSIGGYMAQSAAAFLGGEICLGVVLLNSAGPLLSVKDYQTLLQNSGGTVIERMQKGYGSDAGLPEYSPPPQWLVDFGAWALLTGLQPNISGILKRLYPSNQEPTADLALEILRDSKDPFASNVIGCFSRLGPNRPTNELLAEYASTGGRLLICQGMADQLGGGPDNQPIRLQGFQSAVPGMHTRGVPLDGCGHCPHHEAPTRVADAVHSWVFEEVRK
ncbi:unnamed protein product [Effrenium voratum]|uniref:Photolyase/cryptochrome alpha/beta domain-containing protein n=1 Tax=Effrenium voratum TaxID=2562239 RepID=A0AA36N5J2_9DINO|nr:unnamed protein product [Effrenium voratum]CAJ1427919.1 unnamed protein product [Effrenium voratum]